MEGRIPQEIVNQVIQAHNIIDIVGQYVALKKSGRNYFGLCPFHSEKTPSFSVSEKKQIYYCFGCKAGGDLIKFVMEVENYSFLEAITSLAKQKGIHLPELAPTSTKLDNDKDQMKQILDVSAKFYHHILINTDVGKSAREYLFKRGITKDTMETFQLGFAPKGNHILLQFLKRRGFHETLLMKLGLVGLSSSKAHYDYFRDRVIFPIHNIEGDVVGFGGRLLGEGKPKYLNSPENVVFHKGSLLYNFHRARPAIRKSKQATLFEGYMDVLVAWQAGIDTGVASLGTSLTDIQVKILKKISEALVICYDADFAGQSAALKGLEILRKHQILVKVAQLPVGLDPDDYIQQHGAISFKEDILGNTLSYMHFTLECLKRKFNLQDEDDRMNYVLKAIHLITDLPHVIEQDYYLRNLAEEFKIPFNTIKEEQQRIKFSQRKNGIRDKGLAKWNNGYHNLSKYLSDQSRHLSMQERSERLLLAYMMRDRSTAEWVQQTLGDQFYTETYAVLAAYIYAYYAREKNASIQGFIQTLDDKDLIAKASELSMLDIPDRVSQSALLDYVNHIMNYPIQKEIEEKERQTKHLSKIDQPVKAAELMLEITELKKKLVLGKNREGGKKSCQTMNTNQI